MGDIFGCLGFSLVETAHDSHEGIRAMRAHPVHLICTSAELRLRLPNAATPAPDAADEDPVADRSIEATTFIRRLRHSPRSPNPFTPILLTLNSGAPAEDAHASGVSSVVNNPLDARALRRALCYLIDDKRLFITADSYRGPCRRAVPGTPPSGQDERRVRAIRLMKSQPGRRR